jgi:hypothetical protein
VINGKKAFLAPQQGISKYEMPFAVYERPFYRFLAITNKPLRQAPAIGPFAQLLAIDSICHFDKLRVFNDQRFLFLK